MDRRDLSERERERGDGGRGWMGWIDHKGWTFSSASNELHSGRLGVMTDAFWLPGELMKACQPAKPAQVVRLCVCVCVWVTGATHRWSSWIRSRPQKNKKEKVKEKWRKRGLSRPWEMKKRTTLDTTVRYEKKEYSERKGKYGRKKRGGGEEEGEENSNKTSRSYSSHGSSRSSKRAGLLPTYSAAPVDCVRLFDNEAFIDEWPSSCTLFVLVFVSQKWRN